MKRLQPGQVSLERALSKLGIASRTQARRWIEEGRVRVNGVIRTHPGFAVKPETARIEVDGLEKKASEFRVLLLHKPRGVITTRSDEKGRPTVFDLIHETEPHWMAVGRLDWATSGLLLITTNSRLAAWLADPSNEIPRTYVASVRGELSPERASQLVLGIQDDDEWLQAKSLEVTKTSRRESHLVMTLTEGKNREIRRMLLSLGHEVTRLKRVSFGGIKLGDLAPGKYREISIEEILKHFPTAPLRRSGAS